MEFSPLIKKLIDALRLLPGVGPKSAQRMAFYLLERDREGAKHLARIIAEATEVIGRCERCRILCENPTCLICDNPNRNGSLLCIVESPADVVAIEQAGGFRGYYFVLTGHLSPIDGIGPEDIGINELIHCLEQPEIEEVVLATGTTVEGEATAYYIAQLVKKKGLSASRIAHGIPLGGELEYVDGGTLSRALAERCAI